MVSTLSSAVISARAGLGSIIASALPELLRGAELDGGVCSADSRLGYGDEKVANRDIRVWHFVIENGY
jgi:hypothetical protein